MQIKYYSTDLGLFTVVCSTELYDNIIDAATVESLFPWSSVVATIVENADPGALYHQVPIDTLRENILSVTEAGISGIGTTSSDFAYHFADNPSRQIVLAIRYYNYPANIFWNQKMFVSSSYANVLNNDGPYGVFRVPSSSSVATVVQLTVLLANDDMTAFKGCRIITDSAGNASFSLQGAYSQGVMADFFNGVEPIFIPSPDPYEEAGGGEDPLPDSEVIGLPNEPTVSPIDAGLFSLYSPTAAQMRNLADFLWTDFGGAGTTVEQVLEEVVEALKRSVSNPLNSMLGLSIIASQGLSKGSDSSVHVGFWNTGVSMTKLTKQYFTVDCGSLSFSPVCGNTFLDYAPYSKFMIYLPYVGMRLLDANDVVGHTISVKYRGDCVSGALTCYVIRDGSVIQEHTGNCALNIPLTADSWAETISGVAQLISGTVSGAAMGGSAAGAAAGAVRGAASVATNPSAFSSQVAHTGAVSGAAGHLGSQKPFILREAVRFHSTGGFNSIIGYPSYYYRKLGDCHGYTQCLEVHLSHTPCTGVELQEIEELLKKGVII